MKTLTLRWTEPLSRESKEAEKAAGETNSQHAEILTTLGEELAIQSALRAGQEQEARMLSLQRDLRKELAGIAESDLAPADRERANELARQTSEMQKQKLLAEQQSVIAKAEAANAVAAAETGTGKGAIRAAKLNQFRVAKEDELRSLPEAERNRLVEGATAAEERRLRKADGIIAGSARRSSRDTLGGGIGNLDGGSNSNGTPMSDEFARAFRRVPPGDLIGGPGSGANPGAANNNPDAAGGNALGPAAEKVQQAAEQTKSAASALGGNADALNELTVTLGTLNNAIGGMKAQITRLQNTVAQIQSDGAG